MTKTSHERQKIRRQIRGLVMVITLSLLPVALTLLVFGLIFAYQNQWLIWLLSVSLGSAALSFIVSRVLVKRWANTTMSDMGDSVVVASSEWSDFDLSVWHQQQNHMTEILENAPDWQDLPQLALEQVQAIAAQYQKSTHFEFTLPEALRLIEQVSRRYRVLLVDQVPFIDQLKVSYVKTGYDKRTQLKSGYRVFKFGHAILRGARVINPVSALLSEFRKLIFDQVGQQLLSQSQIQLKKALLQEVSKTAIDLYSGRFQISDDELSDSQAYLNDQHRLAPNLEPLRVCLIGQISSGKSTLVNALTQQIQAEVNALPSTAIGQVFQCYVEDTLALSLVDLPGLDGSEQRFEALLKEVIQADLVLWVLKANQPSRQLDTEFLARIKQWFSQPKQRSRKPPIMIGVLNQIDRLAPLNAEASQLKPAELPEVVKQAIDYNHELLDFEIHPLRLSPSDLSYNLEAITKCIETRYQHGLQVQLNRRRLDPTQQNQGSKQFKKIGKLGRSLFSQFTPK